MKYDFNQNFFELFGFQPAYQIELSQLDKVYLEIQSQVHPDKFVHMGDAERRLSMQWATLANEAYQTLKKPINRARYLLQLHHVDTQEETNTAMPAAFLMQQMELREADQDTTTKKDSANPGTSTNAVGEEPPPPPRPATSPTEGITQPNQLPPFIINNPNNAPGKVMPDLKPPQ